MIKLTRSQTEYANPQRRVLAASTSFRVSVAGSAQSTPRTRQRVGAACVSETRPREAAIKQAVNLRVLDALVNSSWVFVNMNSDHNSSILGCLSLIAFTPPPTEPQRGHPVPSVVPGGDAGSYRRIAGAIVGLILALAVPLVWVRRVFAVATANVRRTWANTSGFLTTYTARIQKGRVQLTCSCC